MGRLQRLRGGENLDSLVAEYLGVPLQTAVIEEEVDEVVIDEMSAAVATSGMAEEE